MKKITKFLTLILSLFCVFGMVSPVYAEESTRQPGVTVLNVYNVVTTTDGSGNTINKPTDKIYSITDRTYTLEVGKTYYFEVEGIGKDVEDSIHLFDVVSETDGLEFVGMGGADSGEEADGTWTFGFADGVKVTKAGINLTLELGTDTDENKISSQLITKYPDYVTVENFDDATVTSGTLDVDCWPKVTWNTDIMDQEKYFSEELFESKDGGSTWVSLYKLEPQSGYDTLAVELTSKDSGRMYKLVCTYDGTELYNKTKTVTVVDKTTTAETTEGTPSTSTTYDEGTIVNTVKESYLTDEQKEAVDNGASVEVKTTASKIEPTEEDKNLVEAQLNSNNTVAMYLDLKVLASVTKDGEQVGDTVTVSETGTPVKFTVALDDAYINTKDTVERTYQVVRVHNGTVDVLPASFDAENKTITFETDKFSTYAIMYTDTVKASKTPSTSDTTTVGLYGGMAVVSVLAVGLLFFFKKRNA